MSARIRIGLVGYGTGGRLFHAPYIRASRAAELVGIVVRSAERMEQARADNAGVAVHGSLTGLLDAGVDAVVISTPPATRESLVREAIAARVHVVADKPFAPNAAVAEDLVRAAAAAGVLLNVFHNRRYDSDIVTALSVIASGELGTIQRLDLRLDQDDPSTLERGPEGGLLRDLGSHVIDQALHLLGPAASVSAIIDFADDELGPTDTAFAIVIRHVGGAHSHVSSSKIHRLSSRELRLLGTEGSYVSDYSDTQIDALRRGVNPAADRAAWGFEDPSRWGTLATSAGRLTVPSSQGDYTRFYDEFAAAVLDGGRGPVPGEEGVRVVAVIDAARLSAAEGRTILIHNY